MPKLRLKWKGKAQRQKDAILAFFTKRNGSYAYSEKLLAIWENVLELICENPEKFEQRAGTCGPGVKAKPWQRWN